MRWLGLYLRSRRVPLALSVATAATALVWALWRAWSGTPTVNVRLVILTVMIAVAAAGATLGGADSDLDRTASINWPLRRAAHLVLAAAAIGGPLLLTALTPTRFAPAGLVLRDVVGLLGLTALGAALLGPGRAWIAPLTWTLITALPLVGPGGSRTTQVVGWLIQPAGGTAAACAGVLALAGLMTYALRGCRTTDAPP